MKKSQNEQVLEVLKRGAELTPMNAMKILGCHRLAARINCLRNDGWIITMELKEVMTRDSEKRMVAHYRMPATPVKIQDLLGWEGRTK